MDNSQLYSSLGVALCQAKETAALKAAEIAAFTDPGHAVGSDLNGLRFRAASSAPADSETAADSFLLFPTTTLATHFDSPTGSAESPRGLHPERHLNCKI